MVQPPHVFWWGSFIQDSSHNAIEWLSDPALLSYRGSLERAPIPSELGQKFRLGKPKKNSTKKQKMRMKK